LDSQTESKQFLVKQVVRQAGVEGVSLSEGELRMLSWSESDPDSVADTGIAAQLGLPISDEEYEEKISGLLARRYAADVTSNPDASAQWKQAIERLEEGDHYILIMVERALGSRLKQWWQFWR
jgi:hypothetical protein